eukprot:3972203-Amphidinium_carterae.1
MVSGTSRVPLPPCLRTGTPGSCIAGAGSVCSSRTGGSSETGPPGSRGVTLLEKDCIPVAASICTAGDPGSVSKATRLS